MDIKLGIIGCGAAAEKYYLATLLKHPKILKNTVFIDKNVQLAKSLAAKAGGCAYGDDYTKLFDKVDGAVVAVPHFLHYEITRNLLSHGINVLCEKPLTEFESDAVELVTIAKKNNVQLCVNHTRRMFPTFAYIKKQIENNALGRLNSIEYIESNKFSWKSETGFYVDPHLSPKGILLDIGAHVIDIICWWMNGKPDLIRYNDDSFGGPESVADIAAKKNGCKISIRLDRLIDLNSYFIISGQYGEIYGKLENFNELDIRLDTKKKRRLSIKGDIRKSMDMVEKIILNFVNVVSGKERPLISGMDVINSISFIEQCYDLRGKFDMPWNEKLETIVNE